MKCIEIQEAFGIDRLVLVEKEKPEITENEVLVEMSASSLNYRDLLMVEGAYNAKLPLPLIPCSDGVGKVVEVGSRVDRFKVGDRVCSVFAPKWLGGKPSHRMLRCTLGGPVQGMLTEYATGDQEGWVHAPSNLSDVEASTLTCAAVTAWSALMTQGKLKAGETVLLQGTGGVSLFALLFAKAAGAHVIITSSSDEKLEIAKKMGADETINYRVHPEWGKVVRKLTENEGVNHIVEVGGAETLAQSLKAVAIYGNIYIIGVLSGVAEKLNILPILMQNVRMQGVFVGDRSSFEAMNRAIVLHDLHPHIDSVYSLKESAEAFRALRAAKHVGKIVVTCD